MGKSTGAYIEWLAQLSLLSDIRDGWPYLLVEAYADYGDSSQEADSCQHSQAVGKVHGNLSSSLHWQYFCTNVHKCWEAEQWKRTKSPAEHRRAKLAISLIILIKW